MRDLDAAAMHDAAQVLIGKHDFTTFRAAQCQAQSPVKTLDVFDISRQGDEIVCRVSARSFLHHQVRSMVGSLKFVGEGKWTRADLAAALEAATARPAVRSPRRPASISSQWITSRALRLKRFLIFRDDRQEFLTRNRVVAEDAEHAAGHHVRTGLMRRRASSCSDARP